MFPPEPIEKQDGDLFAAFSRNVVIKDSDGNEIESVQINNKTVQYWDGKIMLTGFAPFRSGDYIATIRVDSRVAALTDKDLCQIPAVRA